MASGSSIEHAPLHAAQGGLVFLEPQASGPVLLDLMASQDSCGSGDLRGCALPHTVCVLYCAMSSVFK